MINKIKARKLINGMVLVNKNGDMAYYCDGRDEFLIAFNNQGQQSEKPHDIFEFKYLDNFEVPKNANKKTANEK